MSDQNSLLSDTFKKPAPDEWRQLAEEQLKGAPFEKKLITKTPEGINIQPIYTAEDRADLPHIDRLPGEAGSARGATRAVYRGQPWYIAQELPYGTPRDFNLAILEDLRRGQNAINLLLDIATMRGKDPDEAEVGEVGACGVSLATLNDFVAAFDGVHLEMLPVYVQSGVGAIGTLSMIAAVMRQRNQDVTLLNGAVETDPLGQLARFGELPCSVESAYDDMSALLYWRERTGARLKVIGVNGSAFHDSGSSASQELGYALAVAVEYIRSMKRAGHTIDEIAPAIRFTFAIGPRFFMEVAKFRAARILWAKIVEAFGGDAAAAGMEVHARTGLYHKAVVDPHTNMLRGSTEAFAAVCGGVNSIHSGAFDENIRLPDTFSRRIARNTQLILQEECDLTQVIDPGGGSYLIESLTDQLAAEAWTAFQEIEKRGGMLAALMEGYPQAQIAQVATGRAKQLQQRRNVLVGVNQYANVDEKPLESRLPDYAAIHKKRAKELANFRVSGDYNADQEVIGSLGRVMEATPGSVVEACVQAAIRGATLSEISRALRPSGAESIRVQPLCMHRLAEPYEELRAASRRYREKTGQAPPIFLANMGPLRQHKARADFTREFFSAGGFDIQYHQGFKSPEEAAEAFIRSGVAVAVICSTDEDYVESVPTFCREVKNRRPETSVILAGFPGDQEATYREAGLDDYIFIKSNNYEVLRRYLQKVGALPETEE